LLVFVSNDLNLWPLYFWVVLIGNKNKMTKNYVQKIWVKNVVILGWFPFLTGFHVRFLYFCSEHFSTILMRINNKMTQNDVWMVWVQKQVIMCWFVTFASFRAKWLKLFTVIFSTCIDGKQQQNDRKLCPKDLGEKHCYFG